MFLALVGLVMAIDLVSVGGFSGIHSENVEAKSMAQATNQGIIDKPSNHSADQTVDRLKSIL
jgi:hypothetical protein